MWWCTICSLLEAPFGNQQMTKHPTVNQYNTSEAIHLLFDSNSAVTWRHWVEEPVDRG